MVSVRVSSKLEASWDLFSRRIEWRPEKIVLFLSILEFHREKKKQQASKKATRVFLKLSKNTWKYMKLKYLDQLRKKTRLLYKILPTNPWMCKLTFFTFYTSDRRWNNTIYHTNLGQNAVFHNFSRQIALSQYSGRSIVGFWRNRSKNIQNHLYGQPVLTFDERQIYIEHY